MSLKLLAKSSSNLEKLSTLLMVAGRSAPRHQSIAVLYPHSTYLQSYLSEYYIVVVNLCHKLLRFTRKSTVGQLAGALSSPDINTYQAELEQWATAIKEETNILMAKSIEGEAKDNWRFRAFMINASASTSQSQRLDMNRRVLESLSKHDFENTWKQTRKAGNTTLLNRNITYQDWKDREDSCTLVYTGKLGCGKSVLLVNMVDDINLHVQENNTLVAYFFTRHDIPESLEARTIIGSLAYQFLRVIPNLDLTSTARFLVMRSTLDEEKILDSLQRALPADFKAYVVLDGIDDCDDKDREQLIQYLRRIQVKFNVLICISHRLESNSLLGYYLGNCAAPTSTSIPDDNPDIEEFIETELERCIQSRKLVLGVPSLIMEIKDALQAGSKGMFLWTTLQIASLCFMRTDDTIRQALRDLPKDLSETFSRILNRSRDLGESYQKRILEVITAAQSPLTAEELGEAIIVVPGDTTWNPGKALNDVFSVLACCGSLLIKDEEDFTIRFVHHSVKTFLVDGYKESQAAFTIQGAKRTMAEIIITYLNYGFFDTRLSAAQRSAAHSSQVMCQSQLPDIVHSVLGSSSTVSNLAVHLLKSRKRPEIDMNKVVRGTRAEDLGTDSINQHHFRSYARLYWVQHIMDLSDPDVLMYRLLLRLFRGIEVDVTASDSSGKTPLSLALEIGNEFVIKALLDSHEVEVESRDNTGQTPLSKAAECGHETSVKLLLEKGKADINSKDKYDRTPLSLAATKGHEAVVKLLLEIGVAKVDSKDCRLQTPLSLAAMNGHEAVVKLLIELGKADVDLKDNAGLTPLSWAAGNGYEAVVKLLLETGKVDVESKDKFGRWPLQDAAANGHEAVVKLLIEMGKSDMNWKDSNGRSPLFYAVTNGYETVVKLLLETGKVNVDTNDNFGVSPLMRAAHFGHEMVVKLLLESGKVRVNPKEREYGAALALAKKNNHKRILALLQSYSIVDDLTLS